MGTNCEELRETGVEVGLRSIGVIRTRFAEQAGTPIQPRFARQAEGVVELFEPYAAALSDLDGFERIWLLYHLDRARAWEPLVVPYLDTALRGLFATRAPARPCPIGMSAVELLAIEGRRLRVRGVDVLDRTPLLDIKPYVPRFDAFPESRAGWLDRATAEDASADGRFSSE